MADFSLKQGEDKKVTVEVTKNGANVDVSTASKIMAKLCIDDVEAKKYSDTAEADHGTLEVDSADNWKVNVFVERSDSKSFSVGIMTLAVVIEFTDNQFPDNTRVEEFFFRIGRVLEGKGGDLNID